MRVPPFVLCLVAVGLLTVMNGMIKGLSGSYDAMQISFLRYVCGSVWLLPLFLYERPAMPDRKNVPAHIARAALGALSGTTFFYGLGELTLADAFTIGFLAPLFVAFFSMLFLREPPRLTDLAALVLGFGGMLIIVSGAGSNGGTRSLFGVAMVATSAISYALTLVMLRSLAQKDAFVVLVLFQHAISALLLAPFGYAVWKTVPSGDLAIFASAALLGVLGHLIMARAYAHAPAARLAPLEYSALIYAAGLDFVWFGNAPQRDTLIGAVAIIAAALLATRR